jgi:hypothetical protein
MSDNKDAGKFPWLDVIHAVARFLQGEKLIIDALQ